LPAGGAVRHALEEYLRELERRAGYQHVCSPVLGKRELYEISGHWSHYRDGMYPPMELGGEQVVLRPSLCPHHALVYRSRGAATASCRFGWPSWAASTGPSCPGCSAG
jgi:threonyl-tRNA synthetase